jgi:hypothetical protein
MEVSSKDNDDECKLFSPKLVIGWHNMGMEGGIHGFDMPWTGR